MKIRAYAKVNLALDVVRKREDGYHDLEMIMAPITLHDLIYINVIDEGIEIESNSKIVPTDQRNIMYKVAKLMQERYDLQKGVKIFVYKHIPTQAGLAGGSADGAAVIKAMNKLFHLNLSYEEMAALGKEVGADIPFCIYEKTAFVEGVGEKLHFIEEPFEAYLLLVKPKKGVSTKKAFTTLDLSKVIHQDCRAMKKGIEEKDYDKIFTKFSRIDNPLTRKVQGSGLGLYITKNLVEKMDGKISVSSTPLKNNSNLSEVTFKILMPVKNIEEQARIKCKQ